MSVFYILILQGPFSYSLSSTQFYIDPTTGIIKTKNNNIDYETLSEYMLTVSVTDSGGLSSQLRVRVRVRDTNDQPSSPRTLTIIVQSYDRPVRDVIGSVEPLDRDAVGNYTCSLSTQPHFSIPGMSALLYITVYCNWPYTK